MCEPLYFYTKSGPYFELSNFAPYGLAVDGRYWPTVEHFFQAQKFLDADYQERIRKAVSPRDARSLGQSRSVPIRADWDDVREEVMLRALRLKFSHQGVRQVLLQTCDRPLVEASPFDYYWGAGQDGSGKNRLGKLLEQVRVEVRSTDAQPDNATDGRK